MGSCVVVTGGSSGIGSAVAKSFVADGCQVTILDVQPPIDPESVEAGSWLETDVRDEMSVERSFAKALEQMETIDSLVNCAGIDLRGPLVETSVEAWDRVMSVNTTGTFLCTRAAARVMIERRTGSIVCISSINAQLGLPHRSAYSASKGAIEAFTRAAAAELGPHGVRVNAIAPGAIETPMWGEVTAEDRDAKGERAALGFVGAPEDIAAAVRYLCSQEARYVTGVVLPVCGGRVAIDYLPTVRSLSAQATA